MPEYQFADCNGDITNKEYDRNFALTCEQVKNTLINSFSQFPYEVKIETVKDYEDVYVAHFLNNEFEDIYFCAKGTTPGGRENLKNEQRIQIKAKNLNYVYNQLNSGKKGIFLGIYVRNGVTVFCTWKVAQSSAASEDTPISKQIKIMSIARAIKDGFVQQSKDNGEYVCAFTPAFLYFYLKNNLDLHNKRVSELSSSQWVSNNSSQGAQEDYIFADRVKGGNNVILYGVPGAGKSWTIKKEYCDNDTLMERVVFHPDYTYSDFVGQILPKIGDDGSVSYEFTPGPFTQIVRSAYTNPNLMFYLVIEEVNRGNAPAIFGDIFQLLDRNKDGSSEYVITNLDIARSVYLNENHKVSLPSNLSIICTMNTSDQNVFTLDTAFQRRWSMRLIKNRFDIQNSKEKAFAESMILDTNVSWERFFTEINKIILSKNIRMTSSEDKRLGTHFVAEDDLKYIQGDERQNSKFPEKVLKYLWDDAFKFTKEDIFDLEKVKSLEDVIELFVESTGNNRFKVFKENIFNTLVTKYSDN